MFPIDSGFLWKTNEPVGCEARAPRFGTIFGHADNAASSLPSLGSRMNTLEVGSDFGEMQA